MNLLNESSDSNLLTRNWNIVKDQSNTNYSVGNEILNSTKVLKSKLCNYNNAYMLVSDYITVIGPNLVTQVTFTNCVPFFENITKIDGVTIDDAEDLDLDMSMYNLLEYSSDGSAETGNLWFYFKAEGTNLNNVANTNNFKSANANAIQQIEFVEQLKKYITMLILQMQMLTNPCLF